MATPEQIEELQRVRFNAEKAFHYAKDLSHRGASVPDSELNYAMGRVHLTQAELTLLMASIMLSERSGN
jgi:hypothetical protein